MWSIFFTMFFGGMIVSRLIADNEIWFIIFYVAVAVCIVGQNITESKQKEKIKKLEKRLKELVGEDK